MSKSFDADDVGDIGSISTIPRHLVEDVAAYARPHGVLILARPAIPRPCHAAARLAVLLYRARWNIHPRRG